MKKILLATTTIVGVTFAAGSASAADKIKLELGGYMEQYFGGFGTIKGGDGTAGNKARDGFGIDTETRIYVQGSTLLDNGLTVGALVSFRADNRENGGQNVKEQFAYLSGDFGALYAGERNGVFDQFSVRAPNVSGRTGQDIQEWVKYANGTHSGEGSLVPTLETTLDDTSPRVTYVTPSWNGLSAGVSYAPNSEVGNARGTRVREGRRGSNEVQAGLALDTAYNDIGIKADASAATTLDGVERVAYRTGLAISYANFTVGGSYLGTSSSGKDSGWVGSSRTDGVSNNQTRLGAPITGNGHAFEESVWELGAAYEVGPYAASLTYSQNDSDYGDASTWQLGGAYKLGPGITAVGQVFYADNNAYHLDGPANSYRSGVGAISGLVLEF
jgi:outer membrane protein OmpU